MTKEKKLTAILARAVQFQLFLRLVDIKCQYSFQTRLLFSHVQCYIDLNFYNIYSQFSYPNLSLCSRTLNKILASTYKHTYICISRYQVMCRYVVKICYPKNISLEFLLKIFSLSMLIQWTKMNKKSINVQHKG